MIEQLKKLMHYSNILVLHSFHYPGRRRDGTVFYEEYARKVGTALQKMNLPNIEVAPSPKIRNFKRLMEKYDARWILDLHNDEYPYDPQIKHLLATLYFQHDIRKITIGTVWQWISKNYSPNMRGIYPIIVESSYSRRTKNFIAVELYTHNKIDSSVKFVKQFSDFLYDLD